MRGSLDFWRGYNEAWNPVGFNPACDVDETETHYEVSFDLPGVSKDDVRIEQVENRLTVSGERKAEKRENGARHIVERYYGAFEREFVLPKTVDAGKIEAKYQDGVLKIFIPKAQAARPRQIEIKVA